jgi:hypothetical protein
MSIDKVSVKAGGKYLPPAFIMVSCLAYSWTLKI